MNTSLLSIFLALALGVSAPALAHNGAKQDPLTVQPSYTLMSERLADGGDYVGADQQLADGGDYVGTAQQTADGGDYAGTNLADGGDYVGTSVNG